MSATDDTTTSASSSSSTDTEFTPITAAEVETRWTNRTMDYRDCTSDEEWERLWLEPVERFGISYYLRDLDEDQTRVASEYIEHSPGWTDWRNSGSSLPDPIPFPIERITHSTQPGVLLGIVHHVLIHGTHEAPVDPEGWFNNPHPLLLLRTDGTAILRDGNHRVCGGKLRGDATILSHVVHLDR